jgi:hypothetical protein
MALKLSLQELVTRRKLERYDPTGGFKTGQHKAVVIDETAIVSFMGDDNCAYQFFCFRSEDDTEWVAHPQLLRIGPNFIELRNVPKSMGMDDPMLRAIQEAQAEATKKKVAKRQVKDQPQG